MARPREFDEELVLEAALLCFWRQGYDGASVREIVAETGLTGASLYNAFGDKRSLYEKALSRYVEHSIEDRIRRCEDLAPVAAVELFFDEILERSLADPDRKGCMLVNGALEVAPHDPHFRTVIGEVLKRIEAFFLGCIERGQADGTITSTLPASALAGHLLTTLMGTRVLSRVRPDAGLLEGAIAAALATLRPSTVAS